jgi:hypothetical protein
MSKKLALSLLVYVPFVVFSTWVAVQHGPLGFLPAATDGVWGTQVFLDLCISLFLAMQWMFPDAKRRGINPWPFALACLPLGSIGALTYLVYREVVSARSEAPVTA